MKKIILADCWVIFPWLVLLLGYIYFDAQNHFVNTYQLIQTGSGDTSRLWYQNFAAPYFIAASASGFLSEIFPHPIPKYYELFFGNSVVPLVLHNSQIIFIVFSVMYLLKKHFAKIKTNLVLSTTVGWIALSLLIFIILNKIFVPRYAIIYYSLVMIFNKLCFS